jgi:hypothetical protein
MLGHHTLYQEFSMPYWVLNCDSCKAEIIRSEITDKEVRALFPTKPELPTDGQLDCPSCGSPGKYHTADFIYRV